MDSLVCGKGLPEIGPSCLNLLARSMGKAKAGPVVTDNGNFVIDTPYDESAMQRPAELLQKIKM